MAKGGVERDERRDRVRLSGDYAMQRSRDLLGKKNVEKKKGCRSCSVRVF